MKLKPLKQGVFECADRDKGPLSSGFRIGAGIFALAFLVRLFYLCEMSESPTFLSPIVDSEVYDRLARGLAGGGRMYREFFWQPFFYPFFLSRVYYFCSGSIICAKLVQIFLGSLTCVLVVRIGQRVAGKRVSILAGIITAFYGPLIFFEGRLLAAGWAAFWAAALVLAFLKALEKKDAVSCFIVGVIGGLSVITRPTFIPFTAAALVWLALSLHRRAVSWKQISLKTAVMLAGFSIVTGAVAVQNFSVTGRFSFLPRSGAINLYIGNNPDRPQTLAVRPADWKELTRLPRRYGSTDERQDQQFFMRKFREYITKHPLHYVKGLGFKAVQFVNSREIPRNIDVYVFRKYSWILSVLTWKWKGFGFPFGLLLPLAITGLVVYRREIPGVIIAFLIFYPLSVILVFVSARYRIAVIPILAVPAAAGLERLWRTIKSANLPQAAAMSAVFVPVILFCSIPGPFVGEGYNHEAEMCYFLGLKYTEQGQYDKACDKLTEAIELAPGCSGAYSAMALALGDQQKFEQALEYHSKAIRTDPYYAKSYVNLGITLARQGKYEEAIQAYKKATQIDPYLDTAYYNRGMSLVQLGRGAEAIELYKKALRLTPRNDITKNLAWILATCSDEQVRNGEEAMYFAEILCKNTNYKNPEHMYVLAAAYAEAERFDDAVRTAREALKLVGRSGEEKLYGQIAQALELFKQEKSLRQFYDDKTKGRSRPARGAAFTETPLVVPLE